MKTGIKAKIEKAAKLFKIIKARRALEAEEKELKEWAKIECAGDGVLEAGDIIITLENKMRTDLDQKALTLKLGQEKLKEFMVTSTYQQVNVKQKEA